jgi:hypothetical protein
MDRLKNAKHAIFGAPNIKCIDTEKMHRKKALLGTQQADGRRGKRRRREHAIYAIERALRFNHSNIACLAGRNYLSLDEIRYLCQRPLDPLPNSNLTANDISKIILGEYPERWARVKRRLVCRLGISFKSIERYDGEHRLISEDGGKFTTESVIRYLDQLKHDHEADLKKGFRTSRVEMMLRYPDNVLTFR